jgi:predicted aconitase with swiveling domain
MKSVTARALTPGEAEGQLTLLTEPLSFWGGFDAGTGRIIDRSHHAFGEVLTGRIVAMPSGRGSSSASSVLAEAIRLGTAPAGLILAEPDPIITVGAIVAAKLYGTHCPVVVCRASDFCTLASFHAIRIVTFPVAAVYDAGLSWIRGKAGGHRPPLQEP